MKTEIDLIQERPAAERYAEDVRTVTRAAVQWGREVARRVQSPMGGVPLDVRETLGEEALIKEAADRLRLSLGHPGVVEAALSVLNEWYEFKRNTLAVAPGYVTARSEALEQAVAALSLALVGGEQ